MPTVVLLIAPHISSVPSRERNLRKMPNFTDFEPEINSIKCNTEKKNLNILIQDSSSFLGKANLMQKICKKGL